MERPHRTLRRVLLVSVAISGLVGGLALGGGSAWAAAAGVYPEWQRAGSGGAWSASGELDAAGFPVAHVTSNASTVTVPSGASAFLGSATPFGQEFGSSQGQPYLNVTTAAGFTSSTTSLRFDDPTPAAGWGFALGDVDADSVQVGATDSHGNAVPIADLGFKATFNYCVNSPKPSSCTGPGPFSDQPVWDPGSGTLRGNGLDTFGAAGWFEPTVALSSLTLTFTRQSGSPIFQLWLATLAVPVTGKVDGITPADPPPAPGVVLDLEHADRSPVVDPAGDPVTATAGAHGAFEFPAVVDGDYRIAVDPPGRTSITGDASAPITVDVTTGSARVPAGTFAVHVTPKASPPTTTSPTGSSGGSATAAASAAPAELAATGGVAWRLVGLAAVLMTAGMGLVRASRRPAVQRR